MSRVLFFMRLVESNEHQVPGTCKISNVSISKISLNSLKNLPIFATRLGVPTENFDGKAVKVGSKNQKRTENA